MMREDGQLAPHSKLLAGVLVGTGVVGARVDERSQRWIVGATGGLSLHLGKAFSMFDATYYRYRGTRGKR
jgi:hypothetical protein